MTTGEKIRQLRKKLGLTQEELGNMIGVQKAAINKYETGIVVNLKQATIAALADALHVSPVELLSPDGSAPARTPVVIPDSDKFRKVMDHMSVEDYETVVAAFERTYKRMKEEGKEI